MIKKIYFYLVRFLYPKIFETADTAAPITFSNLLVQKVFRINSSAYWPVHYTSKITSANKIKIGIGTAPGLSPGCYIQGNGCIDIGDYTIVAPNVGIISSNHSIYDYTESVPGKVSIGSYCWIGMNSMVLPNVTLGDHTIVAAGSVVTKSFENGCCVIAGNPAKIIKKLSINDFVKYKNKYEYYGYIPKKKFKMLSSE